MVPAGRVTMASTPSWKGNGIVETELKWSEERKSKFDVCESVRVSRPFSSACDAMGSASDGFCHHFVLPFLHLPVVLLSFSGKCRSQVVAAGVVLDS